MGIELEDFAGELLGTDFIQLEAASNSEPSARKSNARIGKLWFY